MFWFGFEGDAKHFPKNGTIRPHSTNRVENHQDIKSSSMDCGIDEISLDSFHKLSSTLKSHYVISLVCFHTHKFLISSAPPPSSRTWLWSVVLSPGDRESRRGPPTAVLSTSPPLTGTLELLLDRGAPIVAPTKRSSLPKTQVVVG